MTQLQAIVRKHEKLRIQNGGFVTDRPNYSIDLSPYPVPFTALSNDKAIKSSHAPSITLHPNELGHVSPSHKMIAECMIIVRIILIFVGWSYCFQILY